MHIEIWNFGHVYSKYVNKFEIKIELIFIKKFCDLFFVNVEVTKNCRTEIAQ